MLAHEKLNVFSEKVDEKLANGQIDEHMAYVMKENAYYKVMNEAFVNKSATLLEAERVADQLLVQIKRDPLADLTNDPMSIKLASLITKQFGFKKTIISWKRVPKMGTNMYTLYSVDVVCSGTAFIENKTDYGYYDKMHDHVAYIIITNEFAMEVGNGEELLAVILHEIGHNFDTSIYMMLNVGVSLLNLIASQKYLNAVIDAVGMIGPGKKFTGNIKSIWERFLTYFKPFKILARGIGRIFDLFIATIETTLSPAIFLASPVAILVSPVAQLFTVTTRKSEEYADSFATMYGYGPALATALQRFDSVNLAARTNTPIVKQLTDIALANRAIMIAMSGDHGSAIDRMNSNISYLEREIKSGDYPVEVKAAMLDQVQKIKNVRDVYMAGDETGTRHALAAFTRAFINKMCNGRSDYIAKLFGTNYVAESVLVNMDEQTRSNILFMLYENGEITKENYEFLDNYVEEE